MSMSKAAEVIDRIHTISDIGTWRSIVELNFGTNQIQKLPDDIALLENLEARILFDEQIMPVHR